MLYPLIFQPAFKERVWVDANWNTSTPKNFQPARHRRILGDQRPARRRQHHRQRSARWQRFTLAHGKSRTRNSRRAKPAAGRPLSPALQNPRRARQAFITGPPAHQQAAELKGEPKTEMWFIADAAPDASLYVGLKRGVTRAEFEKKISDGSVADCFHRIPVKRATRCFCRAAASTPSVMAS